MTVVVPVTEKPCAAVFELSSTEDHPQRAMVVVVVVVDVDVDVDVEVEVDVDVDVLVATVPFD